MDDRLFINLGYRIQEDKDVRSSNVREADGDPITLGALISMIKGRLVYMRMATRRFSQFIRSATTVMTYFTGDQFEFGLKVDLGAQLESVQDCLLATSLISNWRW